MASQYPYRRTISNNFLHITKEIKAMSLGELYLKCNQQYAKWEEQAFPKRKKLEAEQLTLAAVDNINRYKAILSDGLNFQPINWRTLYQAANFKSFSFNKPKPVLSDFTKVINVPQKSWWENIFKSLRIKRESAELKQECLKQQANIDYENALKEFECEKNQQFEQYLKEKKEYENAINSYNNAIDRRIEQLKLGNDLSVVQYFEDIFLKEKFPFNFSLSFELKYNKSEKELIVNISLPEKSNFSWIVNYKYVASTKRIDVTMMKEKDSNELYDNCIKQIILRLIYVTFKADTFFNINSLCFNGYVSCFDKSNGQKINPCVLSISLDREKFNSIDFNNIDVNSCIRLLNGVYMGNISNHIPVKPIRILNTEDSRFVEGRAIINEDEKLNMAEMPWEDFEHLIRELFSKYFSSENAEVKVTQASRDGGVDAVAFDPDPIKGGKYIIQAKRYNIVVPVAAVRELYGVVVSEGADKGILVTTSDFGSDSLEFAKDKPISLINGANLLYLLSQFGYGNYSIKLNR